MVGGRLERVLATSADRKYQWLSGKSMRVKRLKTARKHLGFYKNSFGIFEPYQVLVDGTFCQAALKAKIYIKEQLPKYLDTSVQLLTTKCVIDEGEALGPQLHGAVLIAKRFMLRRCKHKTSVPAAECIKSMIGSDNPKRYFVASQDKELRNYFQRIPGVPLLYINHNAIVLDKPSKLSHVAAEKIQTSRVEPSEYEKGTLKKLKTALPLPGTLHGRRKRKRLGGPNPLSVLKRKKTSKGDQQDEKAKSKRIRKRKRKNIPSHVLEALQHSTT